jgi:hypothetical protein
MIITCGDCLLSFASMILSKEVTDRDGSLFGVWYGSTQCGAHGLLTSMIHSRQGGESFISKPNMWSVFHSGTLIFPGASVLDADSEPALYLRTQRLPIPHSQVQ